MRLLNRTEVFETMSHRYKDRLDRILNPERIESTCHKSLTEKERNLLKQWHNKLELDGKSPATRSDYLEKCSVFFRKYDKETGEIGKKEAQDFLAGKSKGSRRTYKATLRQFFLWYYLDHEEVGKENVPRFVNQTLKVTGSSGKNKVKKEDIPTEEDVRNLLKTAWNHRDRALIALLADRGMRISEALALDLKDVNFDKAGIYLMVPEAKKDYDSYRRNRLTWSRPALKDWLEHHPRKDEEDAPLFVKLQNRQDEQDYGRLKYDAARHAFEKLRKRAEVRKRITLHKFRHYSTTVDRQKKHMRDSYIVKDKGWDDPSMLEKYDHLTDDEVDKAHIRQMVEDGQLDKSVLEDLENGNGDGEKQEIELIKCPNCNHPNSPERDFCDQCNQPFNQDGISKQERLQALAQDLLKEQIEESGLLENLEKKSKEN